MSQILTNRQAEELYVLFGTLNTINVGSQANAETIDTNP
jgi:hypothetical protein